MYGIFLILAFLLICNCGDIIPDSIKELWGNSSLRKWAYPIFVVTITVAVALGIEFDVLNWGAIAIPILFGLPYIWGNGSWDLAQYEECRT